MKKKKGHAIQDTRVYETLVVSILVFGVVSTFLGIPCDCFFSIPMSISRIFLGYLDTDTMRYIKQQGKRDKARTTKNRDKNDHALR